MPVVALFSTRITDARSWAAATRVTVNGVTTRAAWCFERSDVEPGYPVEGHLRPRTYWPAHSTVTVQVPVRGVSAGQGLRFAQDTAVSFRTGSSRILTVHETTHRLSVTEDGRWTASFPVSLGADRTATLSGTKVIMQKSNPITLTGPGFSEGGIEYAQRLTHGGEYLLAAPWNVTDISRGIDSSNGCTNLLPADAARLYALTQVGDVVRFPDSTGPRMQLDQGYGDWNVPWSSWLRGGLVPTGCTRSAGEQRLDPRRAARPERPRRRRPTPLGSRPRGRP